MLNKSVWVWCLIGSFGIAAGTMADNAGRNPSKAPSLAVSRPRSSKAPSVKTRVADIRSLYRDGTVTERGMLAPFNDADAVKEKVQGRFTCRVPLPCDQPPEYCQLRENDRANLSNRTNFVIADGFSPAQSGSITEICWWGVYYDGSPDGCQGSAPDTFEVRYYADAGGLPGTLIDSFSQTGGTLVVTGPVDTGGTVVGLPEYEYTATHAAIDVYPEECYWIEISNSVSESTECLWYWEYSTAGDERIYQDGDPPNGYGLEDIQLFFGDQAFCVGLTLGDIDPWCQAPQPVNDFCADSLPVYDEVIYFDTTKATTDGYVESYCDFEFGDNQIAQDIWFDYQATCTATLEVSLCGSLYDTRLAVYAGNDCPEFHEDPVACNDDFCGPQNEPPWPYQSQVSLPAVEGEMYKIRVGGFSSVYGTDAGPGRLKVSCGGVPPNDNCADADFATLPVDSSHVFTGTNELATHECDEFPGAHVWIAFELPEDAWVTLEYCQTDPPFANAWDELVLDCPCTEFTDEAVYYEQCSPSNPNAFLSWGCLPQGTYYYPVLSEPGSEGQYVIAVTAYSCDRCTGATGDCFEANETPGCDDWDCCDAVCDYDPYCCVKWDEFCASEAVPLCRGFEEFCAGATGDCCSAHDPDAGCGDADCCVAVCEADWYCCTHQWDNTCADEATGLCGPLCLGCPNGDITFVDPPVGFFDARQPHGAGPLTVLQGVDTFVVNAPLNIYDMSCWSLCETNQNPDMHPGLVPPIGENTVASVTDDGGGLYTIRLDRPIAHGEVAVITYDNTALAGSTVVTERFTYHPADANRSGTSTPVDILAVIDSLNGTMTLPDEKADVDRDGQQGPADVLRVIDLLNGAGPYQPWLNVTVNHAAPCP